MAILKVNKLTNNSEETDISELMSGDSIFTIPYFQRAYKWKTERLNRLNNDIRRIVDDTSRHFLGAIIIHGRPSNPADPKLYDVIDGQQRMTTLFIYLAAIIKTLCSLKEINDAKGLFLKYLVISRDTGHISNIRLHPCKEDRAQLNRVFKDVLSNKEFSDSLDINIKYLSETGSAKGTLWNNYRFALRFMKDQCEQGEGGVTRIKAVYTAILSLMSVVQIDVNDPTNGPKIFDSLNSQQEPMTVGDLIRNEIFSKITTEEEKSMLSDSIDEQHWRPFYKKFPQQGGKNLFDLYFFPYGLIVDSNLKKSEVYNALHEKWKDIEDPKDIICELREYQDAFIDISCGTNLQEHIKQISQLFHNLHDLDAPTSVYPFLMVLSNAIKNKNLSESESSKILEVVESFLVRRAVCGQEPTGLHAVFKKLWVDCEKRPTKDSVIEQIKKHKTVTWPTTDVFKEAIETRPLYGAGITPYLILEYDRSLMGDRPDKKPWIEHVLPDSPSKHWFEVFTKEQHENMKDILANLIPLSEEMNKQLSNRPYKEKEKGIKKILCSSVPGNLLKSSKIGRPNQSRKEQRYCPIGLQQDGLTRSGSLNKR